jgi:hypothetical protein
MVGNLASFPLAGFGSLSSFATSAPFLASPIKHQHIRERANRASAFLRLRGSDIFKNVARVGNRTLRGSPQNHTMRGN